MKLSSSSGLHVEHDHANMCDQMCKRSSGDRASVVRGGQCASYQQ
jgi:hypothetical protein